MDEDEPAERPKLRNRGCRQGISVVSSRLERRCNWERERKDRSVTRFRTSEKSRRGDLLLAEG